MLTTTEGALAVDEHCRVLDGAGGVLPGLYAAGCMGQGGMLLRGHGLHLAWAFTSGRVAGLHAAGATQSSQAWADASPSTANPTQAATLQHSGAGAGAGAGAF